MCSLQRASAHHASGRFQRRGCRAAPAFRTNSSRARKHGRSRAGAGSRGRCRTRWITVRLCFRNSRRASGDRDPVCAESRRTMREAPGNGAVPIRARRLPAKRWTRLRRERGRNHAADRGRIRQEGPSCSIQGELRRMSRMRHNRRPLAGPPPRDVTHARIRGNRFRLAGIGGSTQRLRRRPG